jgi:hypothetical protein
VTGEHSKFAASIHIESSAGPAFGSILVPGSSESRLAKTLPAEPPPMMM